MSGLEHLLRPRSIAVVGASPKSFVGTVALRNCRALGFGGRLVAVNPGYDEIDGIPCVPSLAEAGDVDVALVQVGAGRVSQVVRSGADAGVSGFIIPGAGHTDAGPLADTIAADLRALAAAGPVVAAGPNCMGIVDLVTGAAPYVGTVPSTVRRGHVAVVAQSGAIVEAVVNSGGRVPLSSAVSSGAEAVVDAASWLEHFASDDQTHAVLAFLETVADGLRLVAAARTLAEANTPLAVCIVGRSEHAQRGITAHSGRLAPTHRVAVAALRQSGAVICDDLDELLTAGELLGVGRLPRGRRVHAVTNSGGEGNLLADLAEEAGLELPALGDDAVARLRSRWPSWTVANPLDPWGVADYPDVYPAALDEVAGEPGDVVVMSIDQQTTCGAHEQQLGNDLATWLADAVAGTGKLGVLLSPASQDPPRQLAELCAARGVALLRGARPALRMIAAAATRSVEPFTTPAGAPPIEGSLDEDVALTLLADAGVPVVSRERVTGVDAAVEAAGRLGGMVVLKVVAPGLAHKTEAGLVRLNLAGPDEVADAAQDLVDLAAGVDGAQLLVARHITAPLEVVLGYRLDPHFGPAVLVGLGGVWAEIHDRVAVRLGAVDPQVADRMVDEAIPAALWHARGITLDRAGVVAAVVAVARFGAAHAEIAAIDVNPLMVGANEVVAVDAWIERSTS